MKESNAIIDLHDKLKAQDKELKEITASCDLWYKDAQKYKQKIEEWKKEAKNYQYGDGLDTQEILEKLKEILESK